MRKTYAGRTPAVDPEARIAETAVLVGDVMVGPRASLWYGVVARGDMAPISVGAGTNVQDNAVLHCDRGLPLTVGRDVTVGHQAVLHGCTVEDNCLIGMGAVVLNGCVIGAGSLVAAGALVTQHTVIPPGSLVVGSPARVLRPLRPEEAASIAENGAEYVRLSAEHFPPAGSGV